MTDAELLGRLIAVLDWNKEYEGAVGREKYIDQDDWIADPSIVRRVWVPEEQKRGRPGLEQKLQPLLSTRLRLSPRPMEADEREEVWRGYRQYKPTL